MIYQRVLVPVSGKNSGERAAKEGVACRYIVREGLAANTIVTVGHEEGVDMIVMYTDGRDGLADMLIGSITERVLRNTDIPLLAVRR